MHDSFNFFTILWSTWTGSRTIDQYSDVSDQNKARRFREKKKKEIKLRLRPPLSVYSLTLVTNIHNSVNAKQKREVLQECIPDICQIKQFNAHISLRRSQILTSIPCLFIWEFLPPTPAPPRVFKCLTGSQRWSEGVKKWLSEIVPPFQLGKS